MLMRNEHPDDIECITRIHYAAFKDHPMHPPGAEPVEHTIVERLRTCGDMSLSLLAEENGEAVGHIAMSPAVVGACGQGWSLLGPVGVLPAHQRTGVGSALIREALGRLRDAGALGVVLVGDPAFYKRFGFRSMERVGYPGVPGEYVLVLPFTKAMPEGDIAAHEAFGAAAS